MAKRKTAVRTRTRTITRRARSKASKFNVKSFAMKAALGAGAGLAIKYGLGYLAKNNPQARILAARGANVAAAYLGGGHAELGYQAADTAMTQFIVPGLGASSGRSSAGDVL